MKSSLISLMSRGRVVAATLAVACATATDPAAPVEPEVWRSFEAVRIDTLSVPVLWSVSDVDTSIIVSYVIELRVDGTTAYRKAIKWSTRPDTIHSVSLGTHTIVGDSLHLGYVRFGLRDSTLVFPERIGPGRYWHLRVQPSSRSAP